MDNKTFNYMMKRIELDLDLEEGELPRRIRPHKSKASRVSKLQGSLTPVDIQLNNHLNVSSEGRVQEWEEDLDTDV